jgi:chaperonin GroEL
MIREGLKNLAAGANPMVMKRGIQKRRKPRWRRSAQNSQPYPAARTSPALARHLFRRRADRQIIAEDMDKVGRKRL